MIHRGNLLQRSCKDFAQDLVLYYYGECVETERRTVETHLKGCPSCRGFLEDMRKLLPLTVKPDEPPEGFWQSYSREMREKLAQIGTPSPWWERALSSFRSWPVAALASGLVVALALTFTLTKGRWHLQQAPHEEEALREVLPIAENLDFYNSLDFLEVMDLLEAIDAKGANGKAA